MTSICFCGNPWTGGSIKTPENMADINPGDPNVSKGNDVYSLIVKSLQGDIKATNDILVGHLLKNPIPLAYFSVISAQNGGKDLLFADRLFWSGNSFNQIRARYWLKDQSENAINELLFGGRSISGEEIEKYKQIFIHSDEEVKVGIEKWNLDKSEVDVLMKYALSALLGSRESAKHIWAHYHMQLKKEGYPQFSGGYDWLAVCALSLSGFPGPRTIDKLMYWIIVGAENGDPESQYELSKYTSSDGFLSEVRKKFWLKKLDSVKK